MALSFDQKIFMFPESYNELRKELHDHWPSLWNKVQWSMAFDAELFVELMNRNLDGVYKVALVTSERELEISHICSTFLKELRRRRGERNP